MLQAAIQPTVLEFMDLVTGQQHLNPGVRITAGDTLVALGDEDSLSKLRGTCRAA